jgi:hypothetical protein
MCRKRDPQQNLLYLMARNKVARELEAISLVLDKNPGRCLIMYWFWGCLLHL